MEELAERDHWAPDLTFKLNRALDELGVNVVNHSSEASEIEILLVSDSGQVKVEISDDREPFDPLTGVATPDINLGLDQLPIGGVGIHLVQNLMDQTQYRREADKNCLTMVKRK